jgi:hypothetical protein
MNGINYDFNWLHKIISKIMKINGIKTIDECTDEEWFLLTRVSQMYIDTNIETAYYYCREYILWYNRNKNENDFAGIL